MFWPYLFQHKWKEMASVVERMRRVLYNDKTYSITAPKSDDVALIHLGGNFPYDIFGEIMRADLFTWRNASEYECRNPRERVSCPALEEYHPRTFR